MGLDITVMIADAAWLEGVPPSERLPLLRGAWYDDETGFWGWDATPAAEGDWLWPQGPNGVCFGVYEFRNTCGSFKAHFWAGERWESARDHVDSQLRAELDTLLLGLIWNGLDGEAEHVDFGFFSDDGPGFYGVLLARAPDNVRKLAGTWERVRPRLDGVEQAFTEHAALSHGWVHDFRAFKALLEEWGYVLTEAARRGWCVVGLSE
ncbi:hypothetical protein I2W78_25615 [Streptomyces spinoverrucosus]|uniref:hypothetical protein n=1 Tax=Streptomyces spinoverrucosus TaxID=284043 RepID=UPI0018C41641|nr:hypothetical protein [Streptomyces spinoverrucosus]MBG0855129.1 hypothetical protein [Streptomyces spinoverrucosus]